MRSSCNNMQLKETGYLMFEQKNGRENTYLVSIHNSFINLVVNKAYFWSLAFWWKFKIRECMGTYCQHEVQRFLFNVYKRFFYFCHVFILISTFFTSMLLMTHAPENGTIYRAAASTRTPNWHPRNAFSMGDLKCFSDIIILWTCYSSS